jgi:nitrite reductase (NO-forming)
MQKIVNKLVDLVVLISAAFMMILAGGTLAAAQSSGKMAMDGMQTHSGRVLSKTVDIVRDPSDLPAPIQRRAPAIVRVTLTAKEVVGLLDPASGTKYRFWTFNGQVPGPMIRVRQGDTVQVTLENEPTSHMAHSVDFHAALGPGGGATFSEAIPGQSKTFSFQATTPGLFVYHCGTPMIAEHIANGMYGMILVEPPSGLLHVDHEYYVMQGEVYTSKPKGLAGMQMFSGTKLIQEDPEYFVFNGAVDALAGEHALKANTGETVRIFFGDAGPNRPSSLHVVGEMFTKAYVAGALSSAPLTGVQTAAVSPGSAAVLELKTTTAGKFNFMDHAMSRMAKGLMGTIEVAGPVDLALMHAGIANTGSGEAVINGMTAQDLDAAAMAKGLAVHESAAGNESHGTSSTRTASKPASIVSALLQKSPEEVVGCLDYQAEAVTLTAWPTEIAYRLQARPLLFAQHAHQLVHLTGYVGSVMPSQPSTADSPSFVVDTVDQLAPDCNERITPALLHKISADNNESSGSAATAKIAASIGMTEMTFAKPKITIKAGEAVTWKNTSQTVHDVVDDPMKAMTASDVQRPDGVKAFASGLLQPGQSYTRVFSEPGVYRYVCTLHEGSGMKGEVIVK